MGLVYAIGRGQEVRTISPTSIEFYSAAGGEGPGNGPDVAAIEANQAEIDARVEQLEEAAIAEEGAIAPAPDVADFSGLWLGGNGLEYRITQFGETIVIEEVSIYGTSATGEGTVVGDTATFSFIAYDGSFGRGDLRLSGSSTIDASFHNETYGVTSPATLVRQG